MQFFFVTYFLDNKPVKLHCTHEPNKTIFLPCSGERCGPEWADPGGGGVTAQGHAHGRSGGAAGSTAGGHLPSSRSGTFVVSPPSSHSSRSFSPSLRPVNTVLHHGPPPPLHPPPPSPLPPLPHHPCMVECRLCVSVCCCCHSRIKKEINNKKKIPRSDRSVVLSLSGLTQHARRDADRCSRSDASLHYQAAARPPRRRWWRWKRTSGASLLISSSSFLPFTLSPSLLFFHLTHGIDGCRDESGDVGQAKGSESSFGLNI